jgi:hypothetical protein
LWQVLNLAHHAYLYRFQLASLAQSWGAQANPCEQQPGAHTTGSDSGCHEMLHALDCGQWFVSCFFKCFPALVSSDESSIFESSLKKLLLNPSHGFISESEFVILAMTTCNSHKFTIGAIRNSNDAGCWVSDRELRGFEAPRIFALYPGAPAPIGIFPRKF